MENKPIREEGDIERLIQMYGDKLFRLCLITLGNASDAEDAVQETFVKYLQKAPIFKDEEHKKAWLLTVATNQCRDMLRFKKRHPIVDMEEIREFTNEKTESGILDALMLLPEKYRMVLVLYYVEEYSIENIAQMIGRTKSAIKMRLQKGRKLLLDVYRKEYM